MKSPLELSDVLKDKKKSVKKLINIFASNKNENKTFLRRTKWNDRGSTN